MLVLDWMDACENDAVMMEEEAEAAFEAMILEHLAEEEENQQNGHA